MSLQILEWIEKDSLYCGEGTSDKVYHAQLCRVEGGFVVRIQHGKREFDTDEDDKSRSSLQSLQKPDAGPTTFKEAKKLFDDKLKEKLHRKRYTLYQSGHVVNQHSSISDPLQEARPLTEQISRQSGLEELTGTGYLPQLLNPTTPGGCEALLKDPSYYASPKADGVRFLLGLTKGEIRASNRRGEGIGVPRGLEAALTELVEATANARGLCLDGELLGKTLYVFDVLEIDGQALSPRACGEHSRVPYFIRARQLQRLADAYHSWLTQRGRSVEAAIRFLPVARTESEKRKLFRDLYQSAAEGIVFTHVQSVLKPGRPNSGGDRLKFKFTKTIDCAVRTTNRRSFECFVYEDGAPRSVGFVASGLTDEICAELLAAEARGAQRVAVVKYLYGTGPVKEGGKLFQATFLNFRDDKRPEECLASQVEVTNRNVLEEIRLEAA